MFCCTLLYIQSSFAIILMRKRGLDALLSLSSWCEWLFLAVPWVCLQFVIAVFPDQTHLLFSPVTISESLFTLFLFNIQCALFSGEQVKESIICVLDGIEKSVPRDHRLSSLGNPRDANH